MRPAVWGKINGLKFLPTPSLDHPAVAHKRQRNGRRDQ